MMTIFGSHNQTWTPDCVLELRDYFQLTVKEVILLQVCVWLAIDNPSHLDRGMEDIEIDLPHQVVEVENNRVTATYDLLLWKLKLPGMKNEELFDHMVGMRYREYAKTPKLTKEHKISDHHHVISPKKGYPKHQQDIMNVQYSHIVERRIMDDVGGGVNLKQAAKARLDNLGRVKAHCESVNDHKRMYKMK